MTGQIDLDDGDSLLRNTSANDRSTMTTESDEDVKPLGGLDDNDRNTENQQTDDVEDEDDKFERYVKWYLAYKQDELALMRQRQDRAEYQLGLEKDFHKITAEKFKESQLKAESLKEENVSLKNKLAVMKQKNNSCLQCDLKFTIKCRKLQFCDTVCLQKMVAELKSAGLNCL